MKIRKTVGGVALALGLLGTATLSIAAPSEIEIRVAPPADRVEVVPAPRPGYIYERGHYVWDGNRYTWQEGRFLKEREGHRYVPYALEKRGDTYYFRRGHWDDEG